jgi:hypothetical protein
MSGQTLYDIAGTTAGADYRTLVREVLARLDDDTTASPDLTPFMERR